MRGCCPRTGWASATAHDCARCAPGCAPDAGQLAQGLADIESVCDARVLDVDFDAICALLDVLVRVDGAPPRSGDELRSGVNDCAR